MEEIINFKKAILEGRFNSFFKECLTWEEHHLVSFITELKKNNLDLLFFSICKGNENFNKLKSGIKELMKHEYLLVKGRDEFHKNQFKKIISKLDYPILLMKGWDLQKAINHNLYKRSCDIDIMVLEKDYVRTQKLLNKEFDFFSKPEYIAYGQHCLLNKNGMCIDLHKKLIAFQAFDSIFKLDAKNLFNETVVDRNDGNKFLVFTNEMRLIHLSIHFLLHHEGTGFILLYEIQQYLIKTYHILDLDQLVVIAKKYNMLSILICTLLYVKQLCKIAKPLEVWIDTLTQIELDRKSFNFFLKNFDSHFFYNDKPLERNTLKDLVLNSFIDKSRFGLSEVSFRLYCFFTSIKQQHFPQNV